MTTVADALPVLTFHAIDYRSSVISFSPQIFKYGIARLHQLGYKTLDLTEAAECVHLSKPFPARRLVITFDDGYKSVYDEAFPVLRRYGMSATVFLTGGKRDTKHLHFRPPPLEERSMLNWQEIRRMHRNGITFGAHSLTHPDLTRLDITKIKEEIRKSKTNIEDALGTPILCFAYPYGKYDRRIREIVQQYFTCACSDKLGMISAASDLYSLERIDAYYLRTRRLFDMIWAKPFSLYIRICSIARRIRRNLQ